MFLRFVSLRTCLLFLTFAFICDGAVAQESLQSSLSRQAAALEQARKELVDVLAPRTFGQALESLQGAQRDLERNRKPERIQEQLAASTQSLEEAGRVAQVARKELAVVLKTREDAVAAEASKYAPDLWTRAAERLADAAARTERTDLEGGRRRGAEAEVLLRDAELAAIKTRWLGEARALIAQADEAKVADFAPRSLSAARAHLAEAEQEITRSRYDTDVPQRLAAQAAYEARHATYLAGQIQSLQKRNKDEHALEALYLGWEEPLRSIATELEVVPRFDQGYEQPLQEMRALVQKQRQDLNDLRQDLGDRDAQLTALNAELQRLEERLGGVSQERIALQRRVDAQERLRENVARIETSFTPSEARVYRQGDDAVISLTGINFRVGKSNIEPSSFTLLGKVQEAIRLFPDAAIVVEGHTDADGSDSANLLLSQDRADAVKQYLVSNMGLNAERVSSVGYGEARPVSTNETVDGRARNRRIDLILHIDPNRM